MYRRGSRVRQHVFVAAIGCVLGVVCYCATTKASCLADPPGFPTPTISWDHPMLDSQGFFYSFGDYGNLDGFRVYARTNGQPFSPVWSLPCWLNEDDSGGFVKRCPLGHATQRGVTADLESVEFVVMAYNARGESLPSGSVTTCMPHIWRLGEPWN